jgi:hypothetical protein
MCRKAQSTTSRSALSSGEANSRAASSADTRLETTLGDFSPLACAYGEQSAKRAVRADRASLMLFREIGNQSRQQLSGLCSVLVHDFDDRRDIHFIMIGMPAIEICHHGDSRVRDLGFAREFGFWHGGHADDMTAHGLIGERFRKG